MIVTLLTVTINNQTPALDKRSSEVGVLAQALASAAQQLQGSQGNVTSGNILAPGGAVIGNFVYTPQASLP
jgi:hypothetical protein